MCDLAYSIQVEQLERRALAEMTLAPHVENGTKIATPDVAVEEFRMWLFTPPEQVTRPGGGDPVMDLIQGVR